MSIAAAYTALAAITVTGVTQYAIDAAPSPMPEAHLPALVIVPFPGAPGWEASSFASGSSRATLYVDHLLLVHGLGIGRTMLSVSTAIPLIDTYLAALKTNPTLSGNLAQALHVVRIMPQEVVYGGLVYYGVEFVHRWEVLV